MRRVIGGIQANARDANDMGRGDFKTQIGMHAAREFSGYIGSINWGTRLRAVKPVARITPRSFKVNPVVDRILAEMRQQAGHPADALIGLTGRGGKLLDVCC